MTDQPSVDLNGATDLDCKGFGPGVQTAGLVGLVIAGLVALAACQTTAEKDSGGRTMQLSEWKEIKLYDVDLNIPLLTSIKITKAERQVRDNRINHDRLTMDYGKGEIFTQRAVLSWYKHSTQKRIKDKSAFELRMRKFFGADLVDIEEIRKISHRSAKSGGYVSIVQVKRPSKKCLYSRSGYRFGTTPYDNDPGLFDTIMVLHYCDPDVTLRQFSELFSNLGLVSDRDAMKFMITSTEWAGIITGGGERCTSFRIEILIDKDGGIIGEATLHRTKKRPRIVWDVSGRVDKSNSVNMRIEDIGPVGLTLAGHLTGASLSIAQPSSRSCDPPRFGVLKRLLE